MPAKFKYDSGPIAFGTKAHAKGRATGKASLAAGGASRIRFEVNKGDVIRVRKRLEKLQGRDLYTKMRAGTKMAGDLLSTRVAQAAPVRSGTLKKSVWSRYGKADLSSMWTMHVFGARGGVRSATVLVGPVRGRARKGYHRHLVIKGHRMVTPGGRDLGWRTRANPFVARASNGFDKKAADLVMRHWVR